VLLRIRNAALFPTLGKALQRRIHGHEYCETQWIHL